MNDQQLDRNLRSIGKECFVTYFYAFNDWSRSNEDIAIQLSDEKGYTSKACRSRTSHSRSIIKAGRAKDALRMCYESPTLAASLREKAMELAAHLRE